ncbi:MAG: S8 family serine peptidase [Chitinophagaceae bacterium]|nr:S8 family serine peptidase [Chitinophagaceae bacterium]
MANGVSTTSSFPNNTYGSSSGTSMASPVVAGAIALLQQQYKQLNGNVYPKAALIKALLCNTAQDQGNAGPDYTYGFGFINVRRAIEAMENNQYFSGTIGNGQMQQNNLVVPAGVRRLKVMLYWADVESGPNPAFALVNDLDLTVTDPLANNTLPLVLNSTPAGVNNIAIPGADHINNIEQVVIDNPLPGNYSLNVNGFNIPGVSQDYYVTYQMDMNGVTVEYPFGGETLVPTQNEIIRFNGNGNENDSYTLEFSEDNGMNWTIIDNNVPATNQSYSWVVPSIVTNEGLIRIKRNNTAYQDVSDYTFTILGQPVVTASNVCDGYVQLSWPAITGATSYDVMQLKGDSMSVIANTAALNHLVTGLNSSTKYWFSVRAKNGAVDGRRSVAVTSTPSAGTCTLAAFDNDLKAVRITEPTTGRALTSTAAQAIVPIKVEIKNLDNAVSNSAFDISYQINGGAAVTQNIAPVIAAGATYTHTFPQHPIGGNTYDIKVWIDKAGDLQQSNDTVVKLVRVLTNPQVALPSFNGFETTTNATYTSSTLGLEGDDRLDFATSTTRGRARTFVNTGFARTGNRAVTLDQTPFSATDQADSLVQTLNLSNYDLNNNQLRLDFYYRDQGQETYAGNKTWIRGSDSDEWIEVYNQGADINHLGQYNKAIVNVNEVLLNAVPPQNISSSFQIKFGQQGTTSANNVNPVTKNDDGYTFDDITVAEAFNDVALEDIISPTQDGCQLGNSEPISVAVKNYGSGTANNVEVSYSVNGAPAVTEIIASITSGSTVNHVFAAPFDFSAYTDYNIDFWINLPTDTYNDNDSLLNYSFHNSPLINSYPYLESFEANNGNWYTNGNNSSWQWGIPAKAIINKAANGSQAWVTDLAGNYNNDELSYLYSPCFDLSSLIAPVLSFSHILDLELNFDFNWAEYSTDGGISWLRLGPGSGTTNWYDDLPNKQWKQSNTKWHVASIDIPTNASSVRFRIVLSSDPGVTQEGIGIDDIHIFDKAGIYTGVDASAAPQIVNGNNWFHFTSGGKRIVSLNPNNNNLGSTSADVFFNAGPVRFSGNNQYYLDRNIVVRTTTPPATDVTVRFYFTDAEALALMNANGCGLCTSISDPYVSGVTKYSGTVLDENGTFADNLNGVKNFILPANVAIIPFEDGYYAEFSVGSFSEFWINNGGVDADQPLPLKLLSFEAVKQNRKTLLKWSTDNEINSSKFIIERSSNSIDYMAIGSVNANNQAGLNNYSFIDAQPQQGVNYYRLKIMDKDDAFTYSPIRKVDFGKGNEVTVYPNPVINSLLYLTTSVNCKKAILFDAAGKQVKAFTLQGMYNTLDVKAISKGVYQLKIFTENAVHTQKIIIQ